jgi:outer membrane protein assembly factor BamB
MSIFMRPSCEGIGTGTSCLLASPVSAQTRRGCARVGVIAGALFAAIQAMFLLSPRVVLASEPNGPPPDGLIASPESGWPQWRGSRRDGISAETNLLERWPDEGPPLVWKVDGLGTGWSSPILVGQRLYITGDVGDWLEVFAFDLDGRLQWQTRNGPAWKGPYPGSRATCVFANGRLYLLNAHGRLACLAADTGQELWAVDVLERFSGENITWALSECLLVDGSRVIVTPGGSRALMAALDAETGRTIWTTPALGDDRATYSSPILFRHAGRRILANCSSAHGFGVDADTGQLLWTVPLRNQFATNVSSPIYGAGQVYYVTPYGEEGRAYRLEPSATGFHARLAWTAPMDTVTGCGVLLDGTLYTAGYRKAKWWFGLDWQTGETATEQKDLTTGAAVFADGCLYVLDERGAAGLYRLDGNGLELAGRFTLVADRVRDAWAHPVLLDGRLYLRYHDALWCFGVRR